MSQFEKEIIQAILVADTSVEYLRPYSQENSTALLPLVNVNILDYALEALNRSGIEEVFVYASIHLQTLRAYVKQSIASFASWSLNMTVHVIGGEGCRCFGDAMRDLDAKALIRGNFILLGADTITNADLRPIYEQHKKTVKYDKGAAATLIFKEATTVLRTSNQVMIAMDTQNMRLHHHQRLRPNHKETHFEVPLDVFINNSRVSLQHNLIDPQIAIGSPSMLSLFSDNFDFQTRDDFVRGILINEELLDSRIYVSLLPREQYARKVNNWVAYQLVSRDIINRWVYPLVPDMGVYKLEQQYVCQKNNIYKSPQANVAKVALRENVVVQANSSIEADCIVSNSVIGTGCRIGQNCVLNNAYIMDNVRLGNNCVLEHCVIGAYTVVGDGCVINEGCVVGDKCVLPNKCKISKVLVRATASNGDDEEEDIILTKLSEHAFVVDDKLASNDNASDSEDEELLQADAVSIPKLTKIKQTYEESDYSSSSDDDDESRVATPLPDDTNIFLSEVMDSLARGYREKSNPDFLILEINSSRYAYNMSLKEVNFNVVKAVFSMQNIREPTNSNVLVAINQVLKQLGPVLLNYIKSEDSMLDCLSALEDICEENELIREKISQVVHYLYGKDFVTEDAIRAWYNRLNGEEHKTLKQSLSKLIDWLDQSSEEDSDDDDDDDDDSD